MSDDRGGKRGCLRTGLVGCGLAAGVGLIGLVVVAALALVAATREVRIEEVDAVRRVPSAEEIPPPSAALAGGRPGRVVLDVRWARFSIRAGLAGDPLRLEGSYDARGFDLTEGYEEAAGGGWIYRVRLVPRGLALFYDDEDAPNRLRLTLPPDTPIALEGAIGTGQSDLALGGLWLTAVDLELGIGEHEIGFDEPLREPLERFRLDTSLGELRVLSLGNASPATVDVSHSIGEVEIDLSGDWRRDATASVRCGIGECSVRLPRDVRVDLSRPSVLIGEVDAPPPRDRILGPDVPTLALSVSGRIGEVQIRD